jgi:glycosyltransferase involved in cell wall biosynthesis
MPKKCLIIYPYFALYRKHIFEALFASDFGWEFELVGDCKNSCGIKGLNPNLARLPKERGGYNWTIVDNYLPFGERIPIHWQPGLFKRLFKKDYDAVIMMGSISYFSYLLSIPLLKFFKIPVVFWTHGFLGKDNALIETLRHIFYIQADACLLYGNRANAIMDKSGFYKHTKKYLIYNSLDYSKIVVPSSHEKEKLNKELFECSELPIVVAVGRINREKKLDLLVKALAHSINENKKRFNLLIIGEGPELGALKESTQKEKIDQYVHFAGAIYGEEVFRYISTAKLSVIPGNVGLSAMHAMALGIPVISHNNFNIQMPEFEAIIDGVTGSFYEEGNIESLVSKIHYWVYNNEALEMAKKECLSVITSRYHVNHQIKVIQECLKNLS